MAGNTREFGMEVPSTVEAKFLVISYVEPVSTASSLPSIFTWHSRACATGTLVQSTVTVENCKVAGCDTVITDE